MLLKTHLISFIIVQIGMFFSFLFIYFNPFVQKISPFFHESSLKTPPSLLAEKIRSSIDIWSKNKNLSQHYHFTSLKGKTWIDSHLLFEEFDEPKISCEESLDNRCFKETFFLSSEKGSLDWNHFNLSLINASILFPILGNGFATSVTISSFSTSPSIQMKGFSGYLNTSTETL